MRGWAYWPFSSLGVIAPSVHGVCVDRRSRPHPLRLSPSYANLPPITST
jgi:hypothetical protein